MIFTNSRTIDTTKTNKQFTLLSRRKPNSHLQPQQQPQQQQSQPKHVNVVRRTPYLERTQSGPVLKKVKWGEPFWNLFHVLSEKLIDDDQFIWKKTQLLNIILIICRNLPCPDCSTHATNYLNNTNFNAIQTKQQLKQYFYDFHNSVNIRRGVPYYPITELDSKYSKGITINIIKEFMKHFENKHKSIHMISNDFHRGGIAVTLKQWFNEHIQYFEP